MKIVGVEGLTNEQVNEEIGRGGRFVMYQYCISILVMTFKRGCCSAGGAFRGARSTPSSRCG